MKKSLIISLIALFSWVTVMAQESVPADSTLMLSLNEAKQYAVEHNRTVQNAGLSVKQAEAARWQSIASMLPQVSGSLGYTNMCGYEMSLGGMPIPMNPTGDLGIQASMTIGGQQIVGSLISDLAIEMQDVAKSKTVQAIEANVTNVYVNILATQETVELLRKNMVNLETLYKMTENSVKVGAAEQIDADQLSVQVASMESAINTTDRSIEVLKSTLQLLLGVDAKTEIVLTNKLDEILNEEEAMKLLSSELVLEDNYDYALSKKQAELAKKQVTLKAMEYVPSVTGFYQYSAKTYFGEAEGMNMTPPNTVGVTLNVPIWSSGVRAAGVTEKKLAYKAAQNSLADTEDQLRVSDRQYRYDLVSAYDNYKIQKRNIEVTQRVFDNMAKKFEYGYASSLDVTNTSTNLISAQQNYIQALTSMVNAHINLKNLLNK
ncbi:MAG: TolC family protein [Paludibacteraceae bacterium]|nr:TolC family protein [Paludibacteraceae bacterium]MBR6686166.1 TolC family protein [Paludibacteraceae bacterium]